MVRNQFPLGTHTVEIGALTISAGHPVRVDGSWVKPCQLGRVEFNAPGTELYNCVLSGGHTIFVEGVECVTLGHNFTDQHVAHEFYGTNEVVKYLQSQLGWDRGLVLLEASACMCGEVERTAGEENQELVVIDSVSTDHLVVDARLLLQLHEAAMAHTDVATAFRAGPVFLNGQTHMPPDAADMMNLVTAYCDQTNMLLDEPDLDAWDVGAFCLWWVNSVHPFIDGAYLVLCFVRTLLQFVLVQETAALHVGWLT
jgi:hypothetical protein